MQTITAKIKRREWFTLILASVAPSIFAIHLYRLQNGFYAPGDVDHLILPAYGIMLITSLIGAHMAFSSSSHKSLVTIASRLISSTSITFLAILAIPIFLLADFGPS